MAFWGIRGSLCREAFLNFASKLCWGLNSLWRGTRTGGSTERRREEGKVERERGSEQRQRETQEQEPDAVIKYHITANPFGSGTLN